MFTKAAMIQLIPSTGFSSLRLPCSASSPMSPLHPARDFAMKQRDPIRAGLILGGGLVSQRITVRTELIDGRMFVYTSSRTILRIQSNNHTLHKGSNVKIYFWCAFLSASDTIIRHSHEGK